MSLFHKHEQPGVSASEIDALQRNSDPFTQAHEFIDAQRAELLLDMKHPWQASNFALARMGYAANALIADKTAETLRAKGVIATGKDGTRLSGDIAPIAAELSRHATELMKDRVRGLPESQTRVDFRDEGTRDEMNPEFQKPKFPAVGAGLPGEGRQPELLYWQDDSLPPVSKPFIESLIEVGKFLHGESYDALNYATDESRAGFPIPNEYVEVPQRISEFMDRGAGNLDEAADRFMLGQDEKGYIPSSVLADIYMQAYEGFLDEASAYVAAIVPPALGEDFAPIS